MDALPLFIAEFFFFCIKYDPTFGISIQTISLNPRFYCNTVLCPRQV